MNSIDKKLRIKNESIDISGKMLVGYDLFKYVFRRKRDIIERERQYGVQPSPYNSRK